MVLTRSKAKQESNFDREAGAHKLGSWDQFQANKDLVKGASTYKEELYTTPLPPDPSSELEQRAEDIALSITNSIEGVTPDTGRQQTSSEEELFSSVRPTFPQRPSFFTQPIEIYIQGCEGEMRAPQPGDSSYRIQL